MSSPWTSYLFRDRRGPGRAPRARRSLARYLLIGLLPLVLTPLLTFALLAYLRAQSYITEQVTGQLTSLAALKENQVKQWAAARAADMDNLAHAPDVLLATQAFVNGDVTGMSESGPILRDRLEDYLASPANADFRGLMLARADSGEIILTTTLYEHLVGQSLLDKPFFATARTGSFVAPPQYDPDFESDRIVIIAAAPVVDPQHGFIAVLFGLIRDERLLSIVIPSPGLGSSGRSYVVTGDGYELGTFTTLQPPQTEGIRRVLQNHENGSATYPDPSERLVLGVYRWLPGQQLALLVEQSAAEAYAPITRFALVLAGIAALALLLSIVGVLAFTRQLVRPIETLTHSARRVAERDLSGEVFVEGSAPREIGQLAEAFESMVLQLRELTSGLESMVEDRTRQLATAAEVGRVVTSIVTTEELLSRTVELIRDRFGYYHVSVFLLDDAGEYALLRESTGTVGAQLKARGYRLLVGSNSIIGWVTAHKQWRVAGEVERDAAYLKDELLPDTRSEVALPLRIGERIMGALDVQSREPNAFSPADVQVLQILADQIAVGVENGRLFARQAQVVRLEQIVSGLTAKIHKSRKLEAILESAATELGRALGARRVVVRLDPTPPAPEPPLELAAPHDGNGRSHSEPASEPPPPEDH